jgi:hypothetical protein
MRFLFSFVLLAALAVVSQGGPEQPQSTKHAVPVVQADAIDPLALRQLTSASPKAGSVVGAHVTSLERGLPHVQKVSKRPILAMSESKGWFFYATSVVRDGKTGEPEFFISGYAIKKDGRQIIGWSVW